MIEKEAKKIIESGLYDAAVMLMDDDIRETLHSDLAPCTDEEFLIAYMDAHKAKYETDFTV